MPLKPFAPDSGAEKKIFLLKPRGFCASVVRAIDVVKIALDLYGPPVYVRKEIVHNKHVVEQLTERGVIFVDELGDSIPEGAVTVFSAHGVAPSVHADAERRRLQTIDATCPLVTKVHRQAAVKQMAGECDLVLVIGSANSSNSQRLVEVARDHGVEAHLIDNESRLRPEWIEGKRVVGISSGASAPESLVVRLVDWFRE